MERRGRGQRWFALFLCSHQDILICINWLHMSNIFELVDLLQWSDTCQGDDEEHTQAKEAEPHQTRSE